MLLTRPNPFDEEEYKTMRFLCTIEREQREKFDNLCSTLLHEQAHLRPFHSIASSTNFNERSVTHPQHRKNGGTSTTVATYHHHFANYCFIALLVDV
jgi:hypothetical protein